MNAAGKVPSEVPIRLIRQEKEKCRKLGIKGEMFKEISKKGHVTIKGERVYLKEV